MFCPEAEACIFMRRSEVSLSMVPRTSCSGERWHLGFPGDTLKQWYLFSFWLWVQEGLYQLQLAGDTGSSGFPPHLALRVLGEATMRRAVWASPGHTGSLQGTGL